MFAIMSRLGFVSLSILYVRASGLGVLVILTMFWALGSLHAAPVPESFAPLTKKLLPSVVNIRAERVAITNPNAPQTQNQPIPPGLEEFFRQFGMPLPNVPQGRDLPSTAMGSGFIIDDTGVLVTNNHVIDQSDKVYVTLQSGEEFEAKLIGTDPKTDLAILEFDSQGTPLHAVRFGNSDEAEVGDWVLAIGNPLGHLGGSVTAGIISARGRNINAGPYDDFIQTDAAINRGNSGGPLFNMKGEVIGINTMILSPNGGSIGIGFSVPSNLAFNVINQLRKYGSTRRGWLGVLIQDLSPEIAESLGDVALKGALISEVTPNGPAEEAGFQIGDLIITFDGKAVESSQKLPILVAETPVNKEVDVEIVREGKMLRLRVTLGQLEKAEKLQLVEGQETSGSENQPQDELLGLLLSEITDVLAERFEIDPYTRGLVVLQVLRDSKAERLGIQPGDVVTKINQNSLDSLSEVRELLDNAKGEGRENVLLLLKNRSGARFVALPLKSQ